MTGRGRWLTVNDLARRTGRPPALIAWVLDVDLRRGVVDHDGAGGYRLSPQAERRYGAALSNDLHDDGDEA